MRTTIIILILGVLTTIFQIVNGQMRGALLSSITMFFLVENIIIRHRKTMRDKLFEELTTDEVNELKERLDGKG